MENKVDLIEIEVKAKVKNFDTIETNLINLGCKISDPIIQNDVVFNKHDSTPEALNTLRIRESNGKSIFTLKKNRGGELDCIEKEVEVNDSKIMTDIINLMGFSETVRVNKARRKCRYENYEICLDQVENLGDFIEVEKMSTEDGLTVQKELFDFLKTLGIQESGRVLHGYDTLMSQKNSNGSSNNE